MMITVVSIVIPTTILHQTLHCGYLAGILFYALNKFFLFHSHSFCHKKRKQRFKGMRLLLARDPARTLLMI